MENKKTEVDIILPNYNSADFIDRTIKSVLNQSYTKWRLILVDDFSNTETKNKIKRYSNYIAFLDSDDIWGKNKLKEQIKFMKKNNYCFTCTNYKTIGLKQKVITPPKKISFNKFIKNTSIATSTMIIKRKISKGIRFIDTKICEDYFFKCQILKKIKFAYCLNRYLTEYTIRKDSLQSNKIINFYWIWKINTKYNKLNFYDNLISLISISLNSLKKYGFK